MSVKKATSYVLMLLILLGAFSGLNVLFSGKKDTITDYADIQSFAEYATQLYMTVDSDLQSRKNQLKLIAPRMSEVMSPQKGVKQWVQQTKASIPQEYDRNRYSVQIETWTVALKKTEVGEGEEKKEKVEYIQRRYTVDLDIIGDSSKGYTVSGLPKVREIPIEKQELPTVENAIDPEQLKPLLNSVTPKIFSGDLSSVKNYLTDDSDIQVYIGGYKFLKIIDTQIYEADKNQYRVLVQVKVSDPVTEIPIGLKITMDITKSNENFYLRRAF